ncbi:MAG: ABC transporter ATP-binding protein [Oscillospiraceae bacterium]|nr:ABC transporter ATP-binding protein [Oscillospiraceae bacterium]
MEAIVIKNLTKKYGSFTAVDKLDLTIGKGELFGLLGVNGAGKTTTIKMLSCLTKPTDGDAVLLGNSIREKPAEVKKIISISTQETAVAPNLTVRENLEFIAQIYGISDPSAAADKVIADFSLQEKENARTKTLSGGWQRKVSIAMALITNPQILFLDEPTLGLDVLARRELWGVIEKLKTKMTIILTTHYLEEAEALCDRIAIMTQGKLRAMGTAEELKQLAGKDNFEDAFVEIAERAGKGEL